MIDIPGQHPQLILLPHLCTMIEFPLCKRAGSCLHTIDGADEAPGQQHRQPTGNQQSQQQRQSQQP